MGTPDELFLETNAYIERSVVKPNRNFSSNKFLRNRLNVAPERCQSECAGKNRYASSELGRYPEKH